MVGRGARRASVIVAGVAVATVVGAPNAVAADDDCGFSLWSQSYKNCSRNSEVVEIHYESWGPGAWIRSKANWCIRPGETATVGLPDGSVAYGGRPVFLAWCEDRSVMNDHPSPEEEAGARVTGQPPR